MESPTQPLRDAEQNQTTRFWLAGLLGIDLLLLALLFMARVGTAIAVPALVVSFAVSLAPPALTYVRNGRLRVTPALFFLGLLALYTMPITVYAFATDPEGFVDLVPAAFLLTIAVVVAALVVTVVERPTPLPNLARLLAREQPRLAIASYFLVLIGIAWLFIVFGGPGGAYRYLYELSYYEKHVHFQGAAALGLFSLCFEVAGLLAAIAAAVPKAERRIRLIWLAPPLVVMIAAVTNQGYRSPLILALGIYLVSRSCWPNASVSVVRLGIVALALVPAFLAWSYVRTEISSGNITAIDQMERRVQAADWTNLHESEIGTMMHNAQVLIQLLDHGSWHYSLGETFVLGPVESMVPTWFWRDRPDSIQIVFTREVAPEFEAGGTKSFSFVLEGYLNFYLVGAAVVTAALTALLVRLNRLAERHARTQETIAVVLAYISCTLVWFYIRDDAGDLVRRWILTLVIAFVGLFLGGILAKGLFKTAPTGGEGTRRPLRLALRAGRRRRPD